MEDIEKFRRKNHSVQHLSPVGIKTISTCCWDELIRTPGKRKLCFLDVLTNPDIILCKAYARKLYDYCRDRKNTHEESLKTVFKLYWNMPTIFKPSTAAYFYLKYQPKIAVLDPTMGWGGRLLGASVANVPKYIGFDSNARLEPCYKKLIEIMGDTCPEIDIKFEDCITVDYSKLDYDMVFTSPPYWNIEQYNGQPVRTKAEWFDQFYRPVFGAIWKHLKPGGTMIINVYPKLYPIFVEILGECTTQELILRRKRFQTNDIGCEYAYVWIKPQSSCAV